MIRAAHSTRRAWRWIRYAALFLFILLVSGACWALSDGRVPQVEQLFPDHGEWLRIDVPRGQLDAELEQLLLEGWQHISLAGASLGREPLPEPQGIGVILRTRPWRLGVWRGVSEGTLIVVASQGLGHLTARVSSERVLSLQVGNRAFWAVIDSGVVLISDRKDLLSDARGRLESATRERLGSSFEIHVSTPDAVASRAGGVSEVVPVPAGALAVYGRLEHVKQDEWRFLYTVKRATAWPQDDEAVSWGLSQWRDLVERENVGVRLTKPCSSMEGAELIYQGEWQLSGVARAFARLTEGIRYWNDR